MEKRLLFIYYQNIKAGGVSKVLSNLVNELVNEDYKIDILFLMEKHKDFYPIDYRVTKHYVNSFAYWTWSLTEFNRRRLRFIPKIQSVNNYIYQLGATLLMNKWLKENHKKYDHIISCWYKLSCTLAINKDVSHKTIAWEHINHQVGGFFYNNLKSKYKNLKAVVSLTKIGFEYYKKINPKSYVIPNIMSETFEELEFIPTHEKENIILMPTRLDHEKNVLDFLEIINDTDLKNWKVKIFGDGTQKDQLLDFIRQKNMSNVMIYGAISSSDIIKEFKKSKIVCLTSLKEGLPTVLIEAIFSSNVLIAYDCPSGPAEIINENNGFLIPLRDKNEFKKQLAYLIENPESLNNLMKSSFSDSKKWKKKSVIEKWKLILNS
ncbi:glycosyltransferase [Chryseobacterium sp. Hurlbut01]|jgi:glycosyltransferase involved in cell wall biosynthesis|uniref:glycosyltransferase n=1 Tax=Chryseobacterium sp. Hurlbut01 TaxID=1681828 RepID=UPI00067E3FDB|nr:glycosyltransferase [Chryseobacterium sp. Hurlbut01]KNB62414.1 hypothetical protein AC804_06095 [Chryseobacterium sp. Hurlbut01]